MRTNSPSMLLFFFCAVLLTTLPALAQSTYGTITGVVTDPSAAVIRKAKVEATNQKTSEVCSIETDDEGFFRLTNLEFGTYTVSASAVGFGRAEQKDVVLLAREQIRVDLPLPLESAAAATVEVVGTPVTSEQLTLSDSKSGDVINSLPLNFRATASGTPLAWPRLRHRPDRSEWQHHNCRTASDGDVLLTRWHFHATSPIWRPQQRLVSICGKHRGVPHQHGLEQRRVRSAN